MPALVNYGGKKPNPIELNPYLKENGSGYPDEDSQTKADMNQLPPSSVVGDGGASWWLKALKRAQEQAAREGRKLDEEETETTAREQETKAKTDYHGTEGSINRYAGRNISSRQKKGDDDVDMHLECTIVQNKQYSMSVRADDEYDFDGAPSKKRNRKREGMPEKNAIAKRLKTQQE